MMSLPSKVQETGDATTRRATRVNAPDLTSCQDISNLVSISLPEEPPRRLTRASVASASIPSGQLLVKPLESAESKLSGPVNSTETEPIGSSKKQKRPIGWSKRGDQDSMNYILKPIQLEERQGWKGWCEVESEPAFFNVMLREFGVHGIKVQEVVGLDEELLAFLPKPVYGLIFLFQFQDDDPAKQEATCPDHIWFANQTTSNACASIALLNIVMNIPDIDLGPILESLRDFTATMNPATCGYQVCNHDYIRQVHNSFTRKTDMLNADLALSNDASLKKSRKRTDPLKPEEEQDSAGFHFIAFVPIKDCVWKLDGLERQPMNLGTFNRDWMDIARPIIEDRMQQYEGNQIQFNLLALCRSPLLSIPKDLAVNVKILSAIEDHLSVVQPEWQQFIGDLESDNVIRGPNVTYKVTQELLDSAQVPKEITYNLEDTPPTAERLFRMRQEMIATQNTLRVAMTDEESEIDQDNDRALSRRNDYTPMIHIWLGFLAENGVLKDLVQAEDQ